MAGLGAPETWQVNEAAEPSVTVMLAGGAVKVGAKPAETVDTALIKHSETLLTVLNTDLDRPQTQLQSNTLWST